MGRILIICFLAMSSMFALGQEQDAVLGKWQDSSGEARIEINKKGNKYYGKIYWLREPNIQVGVPKLDVNNPDAAKRSRPIMGLEILSNFSYKGKKTWADGVVYDPNFGKTYNCKMTLKSNDRLYLRGFVGISLFGRTEIWTRVK